MSKDLPMCCSAAEFLTTYESNLLQLEAIEGLDAPHRRSYRMLSFNQNNAGASRKQVVPGCLAFFNSYVAEEGVRDAQEVKRSAQSFKFKAVAAALAILHKQTTQADRDMFDRDGDGSVDMQEMHDAIRELFDSDGDGTVDMHELYDAISEMNLNLTDAQKDGLAQALFKNAPELEGDGGLWHENECENECTLQDVQTCTQANA